MEYRWRHPEKGYRWLLVRWATVLEEIDGRKLPVRALGAILDVTEQRRLLDLQEPSRVERLTEEAIPVAEAHGSWLMVGRGQLSPARWHGGSGCSARDRAPGHFWGAALARGAAHDFNNILSVILGCAELVRSG